MRFFAPFGVTTIAYEEVAYKLPLTRLIDTLNENLLLDKYGAIEGLGVIFIIKPPENQIHQESVVYSRKYKDIRVLRRLPWDFVLNNDEAAILHLMARTYLDILDELPRQRKIKDFDLPALRRDVEQLFDAKGWLVGQEA
ncbi:MAG: hypothetical protein H6573_14715 [Lewinellaceae bacterium]|nr:hypothetical protein [Phaeodactylibacter sp.]MCB0612037.1 hypothetical protein [Phaeodactylibacter sp.]MCB9348737.1 hypothetical protein [Lewinellaceae bacterium]